MSSHFFIKLNCVHAEYVIAVTVRSYVIRSCLHNLKIMPNLALKISVFLRFVLGRFLCKRHLANQSAQTELLINLIQGVQISHGTCVIRLADRAARHQVSLKDTRRSNCRCKNACKSARTVLRVNSASCSPLDSFRCLRQGATCFERFSAPGSQVCRFLRGALRLAQICMFSGNF